MKIASNKSKYLKRNKSRILEDNGLILPISNCHSETLTTTIQVGPDTTQKFDVVIDTTSINTWIPSSKCETCEYFNTYDYDESIQEYKVLAPTVDVMNGIEISGDYVSNDIYFANLKVPDVKFGAISSFPEEYYPLCGSVDGLLGLGKGEDNVLNHLLGSLPNPVVSFYLNSASDDYMRQILDRKLSRRKEDGDDAYTVDDYDDVEEDNGQVDDKVGQEDQDNDVEVKDEVSEDEYNDEYGVNYEGENDEYYVASPNPPTGDTNDYGDVEETSEDEYRPPPQDEEYIDDYNMIDDVYDVGGGEEYTPRANFARSELILGGVNPKRYNGCLNWHPAVNNANSWSFEIDFGDSISTIASISTITDMIHGPNNIIGQYLKANNAKCHDLVPHSEDNDAYIEEQEEERTDEIGPVKDCQNDSFDVAFFDCTGNNIDNFKPFEFEDVDKQMKYSLGFEEMIEQYVDDEDDDVVCAFRIHPMSNEEQWILGTPLLEKYYLAFNIVENTIGLAPISDGSSSEICDDDSSLFIDNKVNNPIATTSGGIIDSTTKGEMNSSESGAGADGGYISTLKEYAPTNNNALIAIPIVIVLVFIIGFVVRRKRRHASMDDGVTRSTPGINYDFVDPSCRDYVSDTGEDWEGYDDRHQIS